MTMKTVIEEGAILPTALGDTRMLYVVGAGCVRISGPFDWDDARFELRCTAATVAMGSVDDHDASFEHFFSDEIRPAT